VRRVLWSVSLIASVAPRSASAEPIRAAVATIGLKPDGPHAEKLRDRVRGALKGQPDVTLIDPAIEERLFSSAEPERPSADLKSAQRALRKAQKALRNFELDEAQSGYAKATELLQPVLGLAQAVELDKERLALGAALAYALRNDAQIAERILEYAIRYGAEGPPTWPPELIERLKSATPNADSKLSVKTDPPGADVLVDGTKLGTSPATIDVRPGAHRVEATESGYFSADAWVTTSALGPQEVSLTLASDVASALRRQPAANGLGPELAQRVFALAAESGATLIVIAGLNQGRINLRAVDASGESAQRFEADDTDEGVALAVSQMFQKPATVSSEGVPYWAWVGAGAGAAAIAGGVALRMLAVDAQDDLIARQGALTQREAFDRDSDVDVRATSGAVLLGVGSAAITGIAVWVIYDLIASDSK
jgi:hypothetical protein